ncbi:PEP motif-containing protein, putative exosortase substrate [Citrifermentans bemidjiense Bem]|uniref:PEP motif-containing protein, putative exosortase substrate n=1 Tax=Citrifermentans bemidjiense (strain ATCC BAA-1014 / DSM 16622 / JCM 12645 / Bem) TaxID=404380 RepID=B5EIH4_CITBB|nr:choice-of-anchor N protein [Citrifermentans bemidjiense]ACH39876.1 PEP motif-containing protein, putative exosortase substrate [Citrifermentans bemidjiense Bem]
MKKLVLATVLALSLIATQAFAIPALQLYIPGATYLSDTWVIDSNNFELWVIGNGAKEPISGVYLAAAYATGETGTINITRTGSSTSLAVAHSGGDGTVPLLGGGASLAPHDPWGAGTSWYSYLLGDFTSKADTIYDYTTGTADQGTGQINKYNVDIVGYASGLHFDAYDHIESGNHTRYIFAPFSHDGENTNPVPEPGTVVLLGAGLLSLAIYGKRRRN